MDTSPDGAAAAAAATTLPLPGGKRPRSASAPAPGPGPGPGPGPLAPATAALRTAAASSLGASPVPFSPRAGPHEAGLGVEVDLGALSKDAPAAYADMGCLTVSDAHAEQLMAAVANEGLVLVRGVGRFSLSPEALEDLYRRVHSFAGTVPRPAAAAAAAQPDGRVAVPGCPNVALEGFGRVARGGGPDIDLAPPEFWQERRIGYRPDGDFGPGAPPLPVLSLVACAAAPAAGAGSLELPAGPGRTRYPGATFTTTGVRPSTASGGGGGGGILGERSRTAADHVEWAGGATLFLSTRRAFEAAPEDVKQRARRMTCAYAGRAAHVRRDWPWPVMSRDGLVPTTAPPPPTAAAAAAAAAPAVPCRLAPLVGRDLAGRECVVVDTLALAHLTEEGVGDLDWAASQRFVHDLLGRTTRPSVVDWRPGDVALFDARCIVYADTPSQWAPQHAAGKRADPVRSYAHPDVKQPRVALRIAMPAVGAAAGLEGRAPAATADELEALGRAEREAAGAAAAAAVPMSAVGCDGAGLVA